MIAFVSGTVEYVDETAAIINCGGIGYRIFMSPANLSSLNIGENVKIHTYLKVGEDVFALYGFKSKEALKMFKMIISVSGAGPKAGLSILSVLSPAEFALAVVTNDFKAITKAQGVGPKLAQKISLELKDKLSNESLLPSAYENEATAGIINSGSNDALEALLVLGYTQSEAAKAVSQVEKGLPTGETVKEALKLLAKN